METRPCIATMAGTPASARRPASVACGVVRCWGLRIPPSPALWHEASTISRGGRGSSPTGSVSASPLTTTGSPSSTCSTSAGLPVRRPHIPWLTTYTMSMPVRVTEHAMTATDEPCDDTEPSATCDLDYIVAECGDDVLDELAGQTCDGPDFDRLDADTDRSLPDPAVLETRDAPGDPGVPSAPPTHTPHPHLPSAHPIRSSYPHAYPHAHPHAPSAPHVRAPHPLVPPARPARSPRPPRPLVSLGPSRVRFTEPPCPTPPVLLRPAGATTRRAC